MEAEQLTNAQAVACRPIDIDMRDPKVQALYEFKRLIESSNPWQVMNEILKEKDLYRNRVDEAISAGDCATQMTQVLPVELQQQTYAAVVFEHFVWLSSKPDLGQRPYPLKKFLAGPEDILVMRAVWDNSVLCPSFLPHACGRNEQARIGVGRELVRRSNFVFSQESLEGMFGPQLEFPFFNAFLDSLSVSDPTNQPSVRYTGHSCVQSLPFPNLSSKLSVDLEVLGLILKCCPLSMLTLGFDLQDVMRGNVILPTPEDPPYMVDVNDYIEEMKLEGLYYANVRKVVLVMKVKPWQHKWVEARAPGVWLEALAQALLGGFVTKSNPRVKVYVDDDDSEWNKAGKDRLRKIQPASPHSP